MALVSEELGIFDGEERKMLAEELSLTAHALVAPSLGFLAVAPAVMDCVHIDIICIPDWRFEFAPQKNISTHNCELAGVDK